MRPVLAVLSKDLRLELRTFETLPAMVLFSLSTFVIFHFGFGRQNVGLDAVFVMQERNSRRAIGIVFDRFNRRPDIVLTAAEVDDVEPIWTTLFAKVRRNILKYPTV